MRYFIFVSIVLLGIHNVVAQPAITNILPVSGTVLKPGTTLNFSCTVTSTQTVKTVTFTVPLVYDYNNVNPIPLWQANATQSGNVWTASWTNAIIPLGNLYATVTATDNVGNSTTDTVLLQVVNDRWALNPASNIAYDAVDNMGIGTNNTHGYKLAVNGPAIFNKILVKAAANWPDYVFSKDYQLPSLVQVARFIRINGHLPDIPSADSVGRVGIDIGSNQEALLKKLEEMTLYIIDHNKLMEAQDGILKRQEARIARLEKLVKLKKIAPKKITI